MNITKTKFINFNKCESYFGLYKKNKDENFLDEKMEEYIEYIKGNAEENEEELSKAGIDAMLTYSKKVEDETFKSVEKTFGGISEEQKHFKRNYGNNSYSCYLDIYNESKGKINIIEVKATTISSLYGKDGLDEIYEFKSPNIIQLKEIKDNSVLNEDKYIKKRMKLFNREDGFGKYVYDLFFQAFVMEEEIKDADYYLAVLNNQYIFDGTYGLDGNPIYNTDKNGNELIVFIYLGNLLEEYLIKIKNDIFDFEKLIENNEINKKVGKYCGFGSQSECEFVKECWKDFPEKYSIKNYIDRHYGWIDSEGDEREFFDLINEGYKNAVDIPEDWIEREKQKIQRDVIIGEKPYINIEKIKAGITSLKYPIYHLDFETFPCPVPRFKGEKPYFQSLFQFSIHIETEPLKCDKELNHIGFLANSHKDVREELINKMLSTIDINSEGTVLVYNQAFEKTRIKELGNIFPEYKEKLDKLNSMVFDLMYLIKSNNNFYQGLGFKESEAKLFNYYHKDLEGSFSIKKVLPIFTNLSYSDLEIGNGMEAMYTYANEEQLKQKQKQLTKYCQQDTWAMVEILWGLKKEILEDE